MADFFPKRDANLLEWLKNYSSVLSEHAEAWGIPTPAASGLTAKVAAYETAYEVATGENGTQALILEKNEKRDALKADVRSMKNKHIDYNDTVADPGRERLGLSIQDRKPTPKLRPASRPVLEVLPTNNRQHTERQSIRLPEKRRSRRTLMGCGMCGKFGTRHRQTRRIYGIRFFVGR